MTKCPGTGRSTVTLKTHIRNSTAHTGATLGLYLTLCGKEVYGEDRIVKTPRDATCLTCRQFLPK